MCGFHSRISPHHSQLSSLSRLDLFWDGKFTGVLAVLAESLRQMVTLQELKMSGGTPVDVQDFIALFSILPALPSLRTLRIRRPTIYATQNDPDVQSIEELMASVRRQYPLLKIDVFDY